MALHQYKRHKTHSTWLFVVFLRLWTLWRILLQELRLAGSKSSFKPFLTNSLYVICFYFSYLVLFQSLPLIPLGLNCDLNVLFCKERRNKSAGESATEKKKNKADYTSWFVLETNSLLLCMAASFSVLITDRDVLIRCCFFSVNDILQFSQTSNYETVYVDIYFVFLLIWCFFSLTGETGVISPATFCSFRNDQRHDKCRGWTPPASVSQNLHPPLWECQVRLLVIWSVLWTEMLWVLENWVTCCSIDVNFVLWAKGGSLSRKVKQKEWEDHLSHTVKLVGW